MKPKKSPQENRQRDLFRVELCRIVDFSHGLIKLANYKGRTKSEAARRRLKTVTP
jgi:hypothetical protein